MDCGGPVCAPCTEGRACTQPSDCDASYAVCTVDGVCTPRGLVWSGWIASGVVVLVGAEVAVFSFPPMTEALRDTFAGIAAGVVPYVTVDAVAITGVSAGANVGPAPTVHVAFNVNVLSEADAELVKNALQ